VELHPDPAADYFGYGKNLAPQAHFGLASTLAARGELVAAEAEYREALRLSPAFAAATTGLAWLLATADDDRIYAPDEAFALATTASRLSLGKDPRALDALAAAAAGRGDFAAAVRYGRLAHEAARGAGRVQLAESIEARIARYDARQTYRQGAINLAE
jgi:tetratricopeptide (TPR) repeat protein